MLVFAFLVEICEVLREPFGHDYDDINAGILVIVPWVSTQRGANRKQWRPESKSGRVVGRRQGVWVGVCGGGL